MMRLKMYVCVTCEQGEIDWWKTTKQERILVWSWIIMIIIITTITRMRIIRIKTFTCTMGQHCFCVAFNRFLDNNIHLKNE